MPKRTGLGKGLDALIPAGEAKTSSGGGGVTQIPVDLIQRNPRQPREKFEIEELENLAASIREHGVIQPLIVSPGKNGVYILIAGTSFAGFTQGGVEDRPGGHPYCH